MGTSTASLTTCLWWPRCRWKWLGNGWAWWCEAFWWWKTALWSAWRAWVTPRWSDPLAFGFHQPSSGGRCELEWGMMWPASYLCGLQREYSAVRERTLQWSGKMCVCLLLICTCCGRADQLDQLGRFLKSTVVLHGYFVSKKTLTLEVHPDQTSISRPDRRVMAI